MIQQAGGSGCARLQRASASSGVAAPQGCAALAADSCFCLKPLLQTALLHGTMGLMNRNLSKEFDCMKKLIALVLAVVCVLGLVGCNNKTVNIDLPFEVGDVENIEMYHFVGVPVSAEKKVIVAEETIKNLYDMFEGLSLELKEVEETAGAEITSFRFNLSDGTSYELIYGCDGVKTGNLKSSTDNFEYFTSADISSYWSNTDLEAVPVEESELPN